ncbi:hypothetical protein JYT84_00515 [bacterium AH-315-M10]|nr:hypothetical protein [bacterium AH-315-M10]
MERRRGLGLLATLLPFLLVLTIGGCTSKSTKKSSKGAKKAGAKMAKKGPKAGAKKQPKKGALKGDLTEEQKRVQLIKQGKKKEAAASYLKTAKASHAKGNHEAARADLRRATVLDPANAEAKALLAKVSKKLGLRPDELESVMARESGQLQVRIQKALQEVDRRLQEGQRLYGQKKFAESIATLERALEILKWLRFNIPGRKDREDRIKRLITQVKRDKLEYDRQIEIARRTKAQRIQRQAEVARMTRLRDKIARLFNEANIQFRRENYARATKLYNEVVRLDPANREAARLADLSNRSFHMKLADENRRELIEQWLRLTERTNAASLPMTQLVRYASEETWIRISKRRPREAGGDEVIEDREVAAIKEKLRRKVTLDFTGTPLTDVVQFLRETTGVNMVINPEVLKEKTEDELKVDLKVEQLEVASALKLILDLKQLGYRITSGVVYVTKKEDVGGKALSRVYNVRDLTLKIPDFKGVDIDITQQSGGGGAGLGASIGGGDDEEGQLTIDALMNLIRDNIDKETWEGENTIKQRNGMLVVRNAPEVHAKIKSLLGDLRSSVGLLVAVETRFITARDEFLEDIGVDWRGLDVIATDPSGVAESIGPFLQPDGPNNAQGNGATVLDDLLFGPIATTPGSRGVVPSSGFFIRNGAHFDTRSHLENTLDSFASAIGPTSFLTGGTGGARPAGIGGLELAWAVLDQVSTMAILRAVEKSERATIVQAPRITAFNTQRANVAVINQVTYIKDYEVEVAQSAAIADPEIGTIQDGIVLDVRPIVSADRRYITMELRPTLAALARIPPDVILTTIASGGAGTGVIAIEVPEITMQKLRTTVTAPDGGTIMIGGLTQYRLLDAELGVPILSDVPLLSFFFSRKRKSRVRQNLLILVRAEILSLEEYEPRTER